MHCRGLAWGFASGLTGWGWGLVEPDTLGGDEAFNNITFRHLASLARPSGSPERCALAIAGDDADAKADVVSLLDAIGYDVVDLG